MTVIKYHIIVSNAAPWLDPLVELWLPSHDKTLLPIIIYHIIDTNVAQWPVPLMILRKSRPEHNIIDNYNKSYNY